MVIVHTLSTFPPCQIEGFEPTAERSVNGSLHLKPSSVKEITEDELAHIEKVRKDLMDKITVVRRDKASLTKVIESKAGVERVSGDIGKIMKKKKIGSGIRRKRRPRSDQE